VVPPFLKFTVPVAPVVTSAVSVMRAFRFSGEAGNALREIADEVGAGEVDEELLADDPEPPLLEADTKNVYEVDEVSAGTAQDSPGEATVQPRLAGLEVTV
jgi:hypothetical protein